ncbi:unnamed protein product, partial [Ixodes pacificus]
LGCHRSLFGGLGKEPGFSFYVMTVLTVLLLTAGDSRRVVAGPAQNGREGRPGPSRTSRRVPVADVAATSEHVKTALAKLVDGGFQESLEWLLSSLEDAVEDWDSEDATSTPLVPLVEAHHSSMEDGDFCSLLRSIGVTPPVDEQ